MAARPLVARGDRLAVHPLFEAGDVVLGEEDAWMVLGDIED